MNESYNNALETEHLRCPLTLGVDFFEGGDAEMQIHLNL